MRLVFSEVNAPVENVEINTAQISAGHHRLSQRILEVPLDVEFTREGLLSFVAHYSSR
jgi:hypothetical protein